MWSLPASAVVPTLGNPFAELALLEAFAVMTILVIGAFVFLMARLTNGGLQAWVVHCPLDGSRARVVWQGAPRGGIGRVIHCSKWPARRSPRSCDRRCLAKAA
jgi:hypothetical protein